MNHGPTGKFVVENSAGILVQKYVVEIRMRGRHVGGRGEEKRESPQEEQKGKGKEEMGNGKGEKERGGKVGRG
jgi:hypothetical protein